MIDFYKDKKVLVTGHTGFKGTWLCKILLNAGAKVIGYALPPETEPNLFDLTKIEKSMTSIFGDIRDFDKLSSVFDEYKPEIVFHLAAQPIVRESYKNPRYTYDTNVMGTVNLMECIRLCNSVKSVVNVTTDKVYKNLEWDWGYREIDELNGHDPYSNSKSCSELITQSYVNSFFSEMGIAVSTARAGNVIGGGDFSVDRIIPDCVRSAISKNEISIRNPHSIRPYQHVLEPLFAYLHIASKQYMNISFASSYNVGPNDIDCISTKKLVDMFCEYWGEGLRYNIVGNQGPHEANFLKLDCSKIKNTLSWHPLWNIQKAIKKTVEWTHSFEKNEDVNKIMDVQIFEFFNHERVTK